jgi:large subunit ribosomal protein L13
LARAARMPYHAQAPVFRGFLYVCLFLFEDCFMKPKLQRTFTPKPGDLNHEWFVVDAADVPLGRLASPVAQILRGKHKPTFAPHVDGGDYVIVINADKIAVTGKKEDQKIYYRHSGYPGGLRAATLAQLRESYPDRVIRNAVRGMLPKNRLGRQTLSKLKVYAGPDHPHAAQNPQPFDIRKVGA